VNNQGRQGIPEGNNSFSENVLHNVIGLLVLNYIFVTYIQLLLPIRETFLIVKFGATAVSYKP